MFAIRPVSRDRLSHWLTWSDAAVAVASSILSPVIWSLGHAPMSDEAMTRYILIAIVVSIAAVVFGRIGQIAVRFFSACDAISLLRVAALSIVVISAFHFMLNRGDGIGRGLPAFHFFIFALGLFATRAIERRSLGRDQRRMARAQRPETVIVIGASRLAVGFIVSARLDGRRRVLAVLDSDRDLLGRSVAGCPVIGSPASLESVIAEYAIHGLSVDKLFLGIDPGQLNCFEAKAVAAVAKTFDCHVLDQSEIISAVSADPDFTPYASHDLPAVEEVRSRFIWDLKRVCDVSFSLTFLAILSPLYLLCSLVALFELGFPIFFLQERLGRDGRPIDVLKFRTMRAGAATPSQCGAYLRRTRMDELPQLLNILRGQMSLIGPRPLLASEQGSCPSFRLAALPGLTGWAQVCGAKLCTLEEKIALDEWYVLNASLSLDARIMFMTVRVVAFGEVRREHEINLALAERAARLARPSAPTVDMSKDQGGVRETARARIAEPSPTPSFG